MELLYIFFNDFNGIRRKVQLDSRIHVEKSGHNRVRGFLHCFLVNLSKSIGMGAQSHKSNHKSYEGEK